MPYMTKSFFSATVLTLVLALATAGAQDAPPTKQQIEGDLELQVVLTTPATVFPGQPVAVDANLHNKSKGVSYPVVAPGDGSEAGWREPYVHFSATIDKGDGQFVPVAKRQYARCGLFDPNWGKSVQMLKPGAKLPLRDWINRPSDMLEFQEPGRVRLVAHYAYRGGMRRGGEKGNVPAGPMAGVPDFEVISAPVEFTVARSLGLKVTVKKPIVVKTKTPISELLDVQLANSTKEPVEFSVPTLSAEARLGLEIEGKFAGWRPKFTKQTNPNGDKGTLQPGEEVSLIGAATFANGMDGTWEYPVEDTIRVRAVYWMSTWKAGPVLYSAWVEIKAVAK